MNRRRAFKIKGIEHRLSLLLFLFVLSHGSMAQQPVSPVKVNKDQTKWEEHTKYKEPVTIYTLKECIELGLENNYSVLISRNNEEITHNNATAANAGYLPTIDISAGYDGKLQNTETTPRIGETTKETGVYDQTINAGIGLNWTIFDGFKIQTNYKRLKELEKQGELSTRITIENFVADMAAEYYNYVRENIRLKNYKYAVSLSKERLRIVEERYNIGSFSRLDLQQARVDFNADSAKYMKQQELLASSRIRLNELMALNDVNHYFHAIDSVINANELLVYEPLINSAMKVNASLIKADRANTLANMDLKLIDSRNYPYVRFNTNYGYTFNKYETGSTDRRQNLGLNFGLTVGFKLFDGNRKRERKNALLEIENTRLAHKELEQSIKADLNNLWQAYQNNIEMLNLERENIIAAKENVEIAMERYMLGNLSGIEMREAQKSLLDAEERLVSVEFDTKLCEISLMQISGKILHYID